MIIVLENNHQSLTAKNVEWLYFIVFMFYIMTMIPWKYLRKHFHFVKTGSSLLRTAPVLKSQFIGILLCLFNGSVNIHEFVSFSNMIVLPYILKLLLNLAFRKLILIDKCILIRWNYSTMKKGGFCKSFLDNDVV